MTRFRNPDPSRPSGASGFTLVEALLAVLLLVTAAGSLARALSAAALARRSAADTGLAARVARDRMDRLQANRLTDGWPFAGYHQAVRPGGGVDLASDPVPGYVEYFDAAGAPTDQLAASSQVRWRIEELTGPGDDRLAVLRFEVVAGPAPGQRGPVVRLESVRVANRE